MATSHWQERNLATLLLVRSVEEHDPAYFAPEVRSAAALAAANARDDRELIERRSAYLFLRLPASLKAWARIGLLPETSLSAVVAIAALAGALLNFLGPSGLVHVVYNPLVLLIAWNLAAYAVFAWRAVHTPRAGLLRLLVRDLWSAWNRWANRLPGGSRLHHGERIAASFAGLALAGTGYLIGRDKVNAAMKRRLLPAALVAFALPESKLEQARQATYATVKQEVAAHLDPQVTRVTEAIVERLTLTAQRTESAPGPPR